MTSPADGLALRIAASASLAHGMWTIEKRSQETFVVEMPTQRRLAVVRDLGPIRTAHLMAGDPPVLAGQKGPLDPRVLGARVARFAMAHPGLVTILDVAFRILDALSDCRMWWSGDWDGIETSAYIQRRGGLVVRVTQRKNGVLVRIGDEASLVRDEDGISSVLGNVANSASHDGIARTCRFR
jgi:hypothetical protein